MLFAEAIHMLKHVAGLRKPIWDVFSYEIKSIECGGSAQSLPFTFVCQPYQYSIKDNYVVYELVATLDQLPIPFALKRDFINLFMRAVRTERVDELLMAKRGSDTFGQNFFSCSITYCLLDGV